jgi:hypothetical protein
MREQTLEQKREIINSCIAENNLILVDTCCVIPLSLDNDTLIYSESGQQSICHITNHIFEVYK